MSAKKKLATPVETLQVERTELERFRDLLTSAQHAVVRAPNRAVPLRGYGPVAALQAYDIMQSVIQELDTLLDGGAP